MPELETFQKAQIEIEGYPPLTCLFNPKEYTLSKSSNWSAQQVAGSSLPPVQYGGGSPQELSFEILLDDQEGSHPIQPDIDLLFLAMEADQTYGAEASNGKPTPRPPTITFSWGATMSFSAGLKSLSAQFIRFNTEGEPTRAQLKLTLIQLKRSDSRTGRGPLPAQNPTTKGVAALGTRVVRDGETLQSIAFAAYGDPTRWRAIAHANGIDDPMNLPRGSRIAIPRLEQ